MRVLLHLVSILMLLPLLVAQPAQVTRLGPYGGDVRSLAVHKNRPNTFYLGTTNGQIFISDNAGRQWRELVPGLGRRELVVDNLRFHPHDPDLLYAATWELNSDKGWLFRTEDGGETWSEISLGRYRSAIRAIAIAPSDPDVIALGISEGVLLSLNAGRNWERISRGYRSLHYVESLAFDPDDSSTLYVGTRHLGWRTTDQGKSWEAIHKGMLFDSHMFSLLVNPEDPSVVYSSACSGVYRSDNQGLTWKKLENGLPYEARRTRVLSLDPSDPNTIYAGTTQGLFTTTNGGRSWRQLFSKIVVNTVAVHPENSQIVIVGTDDAGILRSTDQGATFSPANQGFIHRQISAISADPHQVKSYYLSVSSDGSYGGFFLTQDAGNTWETYNNGLPEASPAIRAILPATRSKDVYLGTQKGVYVGVPGDRSWERIEPTRELVVFDLAFADGKQSALYVATGKGVFHLDLKQKKLRRLPITEHPGSVSAVLYDMSLNHLYVGTDTGVFRSTDHGETWLHQVSGLPNVAIHALEKNGERLLCGTRQGLFFSDDHGRRWNRVEGIPAVDIVTIRSRGTSSREIVAADFLGHVYHSADRGNHWATLDLGMNRSRIAALAFDPSGSLLAGTMSDGVYQITSDSESLANGR